MRTTTSTATMLTLLLMHGFAAAQKLPTPPVSAHSVRTAIVADALRNDVARGGLTQEQPEPSGLRPMRVAKWSVLGLAAGAGVYGFIQNNEADDRFRELEELCQAEQFRCSQRTPDGAYQDAEFERMYQDVRRLDGRSHIALLSSQIGVAAGVALFLLDLGNSDSPDDIPWTPGRLEVRPVERGIELGLRIPVL